MQEPDRIIEDNESEEIRFRFSPGSCCKDDDNNGSTLQEKFRSFAPDYAPVNGNSVICWAKGDTVALFSGKHLSTITGLEVPYQMNVEYRGILAFPEFREAEKKC
jgi:hypothetical protein